MTSVNHLSDDSFQLYDLLVEVVCPPGERILCGAKPGDNFRIEGEMLYLPPGQGFSIYSLGEYGIFKESSDIPSMHMVVAGAIMPLLAAKQRATHPNDWMSTDAEVACPDPNCKSRLRITRLGLRTFSHAEVTLEPLEA